MAGLNAYVRRYLWPLPKFRRELVAMVDGVHKHGGLTDRFRNMLSLYSYCKGKGIPFKIYYLYPCELERLLVPAEYDWRVSSRQLSYNALDSKELSLYVQGTPSATEGLGMWMRENNERHLAMLDETFSRGRRQIHEYGNAFFAKGGYKPLWEELFKPSDHLCGRVEADRSEIGEDYAAVTFRFQTLLGDLEDTGSEVLSVDERNLLIDNCISEIRKLRSEGRLPSGKLLVTSDSSNFIEAVSSEPYVYVVHGKNEHSDYTGNSDIEVCAKPFIDMFLLMGASSITQLRTGKMYKSGFPEFAAEIGGKPYELIEF